MNPTKILSRKLDKNKTLLNWHYEQLQHFEELLLLSEWYIINGANTKAIKDIVRRHEDMMQNESWKDD